VIDAPLVAKYRNQGGFDIIGAIALHHSRVDQKNLLAESKRACVACVNQVRAGTRSKRTSSSWPLAWCVKTWPSTAS
jgi:hypothetical protein